MAKATYPIEPAGKLYKPSLAFQLGWDIAMADLIPGYMQNKAIGLAAGFRTNPLVFIAFFDKKYFTQPGGQVHLWGPPEFVIKKNAIWGPTTEGLATSFARISSTWENFEHAKRDMLDDDERDLTPFDKFTHLRDITRVA
jgi:hypothetical protein